MDPQRLARRDVLALALGAGASLALPRPAHADAGTVLVLVELNGGNDGLNTLVPYADRPTGAPGRSWPWAVTLCCRSTSGAGSTGRSSR